MTDKTGEKHGAEAACKAVTTGSTPALVSTEWGEFVEVMRRNDPAEMHRLMDALYYQKITALGWTLDSSALPSREAMAYGAHQMLMLASSIVDRYAEVRARNIELSKENSRLKRGKA